MHCPCGPPPPSPATPIPIPTPSPHPPPHPTPPQTHALRTHENLPPAPHPQTLLADGTTQETPYTVRLKATVHVDVGSVELAGRGGAVLVQGSLTGTDARVVMYPETLDVKLDIATVSVDGKECMGGRGSGGD